MRYKLAEDAKPQLALLLLATVITLILWFLAVRRVPGLPDPAVCYIYS